MQEAEENELLGEEETGGKGDNDGGVVDETAEDLMTDMKLDDETDEVREKEPDFNWSYHIEIYPWNADDMTDNFVRLIKLAQFSQIFMRKKGVRKENDDSEKIDDRLPGRLRIGCLHLYTDTWQNAKSIMRSSTWKTMAAKVLTFEITKRGSVGEQMESAYLEVDTYCASKTRFRDKTKGDFKVRSAKVSLLPGTISREFLDVVFSRAYAVIGGTTVKEYLKDKEGKLQQKLLDLNGFNGSLDFDCLGRGSCRAFVLAHKNVFIEGQKVTIVANDKETMIVPPSTQVDTGVKKKQQSELTSLAPAINYPSGRDRQNWTFHASGIPLPMRGVLGGFSSANGTGYIKDNILHTGRGRGLGRAMVPPQRPVSTPFTRAGPGMPVPMTGRQKMNEKMRRNNFSMTAGMTGSGAGTNVMTGGLMVLRAPIMGSVGDSFKQEIASLQNELERSTMAIEAKIAMLQQTTQGVSFYEDDMTSFENEIWDGDCDYNDEYIHEDYVLDDRRYATHEMQNFHFETVPPGQAKGIAAGMQMGNIGNVTGHKQHHGVPREMAVKAMRKRDIREIRQDGRHAHGHLSEFW